MRLSIKTCTLDMPFAAMLDFCVAQGVQAVEIGTGNWSGAPHIDLDELLGSETARQRWMDQLRRRDIALCALNCSGNPLAFQKDWEVTEKTFRLAALLGVEKIVMMSGLPAGCPGDQDPRLDHHLLAAGDPGHSGLPVERGGHPQVARAGPHGGRTAASVRSRWKTTGCSWCTTRRPCSACGRPLAPWWA